MDRCEAGGCIQVDDHTTAVRLCSARSGTTMQATPQEWHQFVAAVKDGDYDHIAQAGEVSDENSTSPTAQEDTVSHGNTTRLETAPMITARVQVQSKHESGIGEQRQVVVNLTADYQDGRNREWSLYTPSLNLNMTLRGDVADKFSIGKVFTFQFVDGEEVEVGGV